MVDRISNFKTQEICFLDETITIQGRVNQTRLPSDYEPTNWSVICGRGKDCYNHCGNKRLRILVDANLAKYSAAKSKYDKTLIVSSIVDAVREAAQMGGFIKMDTKTKKWIEVGDDAAREKVGQLLREAMTKKDPSKVQERKARRKAKALKSKKVKLSRSVSSESAYSSSNSSVSTAETAAMSTSDSESVSAASMVPSFPNIMANTANQRVDLTPLPMGPSTSIGKYFADIHTFKIMQL
ncbi:Nitrilase family, member 2 [Seminavis robusta]|uniref:Nitrilase family, member 2 n=1 Tax=Seminavis robusta TaxID=568900 RepID=A0A9N8DFG0_9STRA|nr:Nitrilase family, member 2 [Seminavis robusta]|eukprot:Sro132_g062490.1 Nitrilase family, member 2 (239) ;mRNA; f:29357-30073